MVKPPVMLVGSLFLNMVMVFGCASGFGDPASTFPAGLSQHLREQMLLYREESAELRAAVSRGVSTFCRGVEPGIRTDPTISRFCTTSLGAS